jgi:predicted MFS family arabinose efflux permease
VARHRHGTSGLAWLVIFSLVMGGFAIGIRDFAVMSLMPNITGNLGVSIPHGSHMISAHAVGVVIGNMAGAWLVDRALMPAVASILVRNCMTCRLVRVSARNTCTLGLNVFLMGCSVALGAGLQTG